MSAVQLPADVPDLHPVQRPHMIGQAQLRKDVVVRAYEVYCEVYGQQDAMMSAARGCRGGFSVGEIVGFLYARSFPRAEWRARVDEAFKDMKL
jgi:hypothetical protein